MRILEEALKLFAHRGFAATGLRDIASSVGLRASSLYNYFATKDDLLREMLTGGMERFIRAGELALEGRSSPAERLVALTRSHVAVQALFPLTSMLNDVEVRSLEGEAREVVVELRDRYDRTLDAILRDGSESGVFTGETTHLTRLAIAEMNSGVSRWFRPAGPSPLTVVCDHFAQLSLDMAVAQVRGTRLTVDQVTDHGSGFEIDLALAAHRDFWESPSMTNY
ncbi:TetR/AcrR family transcriptional regulator [Mycolicibacterium goodii]|uniref:TetR/AcrR family transcriptional regulator n=1 Tax=Mycolicibacterium goodii TaxID=134601 RepID=UPI001BDCC637|nr:TetR/AcrR family transcriptional regulator [Mycolicibacterium goodii]MBU8830709.1 TetR/AcrR family transcriptional regulator [Mycolicibacterium goodii]